ncbi:MAG: hypothetical protein HY428_00890 [Candidatus Levybacteria bacterium]|nr:hypothetical protein [Candidatus Levybacteria bacterium]
MTVSRFKPRKLIVLTTATAFLIGSIFGAPLLASASTAIANNPIHVNVRQNQGGGISINRGRDNDNRRNNRNNDRRDNNNRDRNDRDRNDRERNDRERRDRRDRRNKPEKKVVEKKIVDVERKVISRPIVINRGERVVDRTVEHVTENVTENIIENNNNNNNNNENINENIVEVNTGYTAPVREVVYETRTGYPVYMAPASVTYTPDTGAGALSFLALIPGGVAALLQKRFFA